MRATIDNYPDDVKRKLLGGNAARFYRIAQFDSAEPDAQYKGENNGQST
jgi:hypothetical protein